MTDTKKAEIAGPATPASQSPPPVSADTAKQEAAAIAAGAEQKSEDQIAIEKHQQELTEKRDKQLDAIRSGDVKPLEGARPEYEPPIGTKPVNPIPTGLVVGGPVLDLDEQARLARMGKGPEQAPGTKPV